MDFEDSDVYNFRKVELVSVNEKFYMELPKNKSRCVECSKEQFTLLLVKMYNNRNMKTFSNTFEWMLSQLEMTPTLFQATLFGTWTLED